MVVNVNDCVLYNSEHIVSWDFTSERTTSSLSPIPEQGGEGGLGGGENGGGAGAGGEGGEGGNGGSTGHGTFGAPGVSSSDGIPEEAVNAPISHWPTEEYCPVKNKTPCQ